MPRVLVCCPVHDRAVFTGQRMTQAKLQEANATRYGFRCVACDEIHHWVAAEAWVETRATGR